METRLTIPLIIALAAALVPETVRMPPWITAWCAGLWAYLAWVARSGRPWPGRWTLTGLTLAGLLMVAAGSGRTFDGKDFVSLLAVMAAVKPYETRTHRDRMITVFLAYFIVITCLFDLESLAMTLYLFVSVLITTAVLIQVNRPAGALKSRFRLAGLILVQALPLALLLFTLFPRLQGNLWGRPAAAASSGLSGTLNPGDIASLVLSEEVAFRAEFDGEIPPRPLRYWRSIVYWHFTGVFWRRGRLASGENRAFKGQNPVSYQIHARNKGSRWLFALDMPAKASGQVRLMKDFTLAPIRRPPTGFRYRATSFLQYNTGPMTSGDKAGLQLPDSGNPGAGALAEKWAGENNTPEGIMAAAKAFFTENPFFYTLVPGRLGKDPVDEFLFETRKGFCEHYASAYAYLMRRAGIPARIVGGYLGGDVNPYGNYLTIRQSDAHSWVEVWLKNKGWVRVDPTGFVSPDRIRLGIARAVPQAELPGFLSRELSGGLFGLGRSAAYFWDAMNTNWDKWFMGFSDLDQQEILKRLGIDLTSWAARASLLALAVATVVGAALFIALRLVGASFTPADPVQDIWLAFCRKMEKAGAPRRPGQGPVDFLTTTIRTKTPRLFGKAKPIVDMYVRLRYAGEPTRLGVARFKSMVKSFKTGG